MVLNFLIVDKISYFKDSYIQFGFIYQTHRGSDNCYPVIGMLYVSGLSDPNTENLLKVGTALGDSAFYILVSVSSCTTVKESC